MKRIIIYSSIIILVVVLAGIQAYWDNQSKSTEINPIEILVYFSKSEPTEIIQVPVKRLFSRVDNNTKPSPAELATFAVNQMLAEPTAEETVAGLTSALNSGSVLNYVKIDNQLAIIDFNEQFDWQMGGSAKVMAIYQQLYQTITQFSGITEIKITINHGERPANLEP